MVKDGTHVRTIVRSRTHSRPAPSRSSLAKTVRKRGCTAGPPPNEFRTKAPVEKRRNGRKFHTRCNIRFQVTRTHAQEVRGIDRSNIFPLGKIDEVQQAKWVGSSYACSSIPNGRSSVSPVVVGRANAHVVVRKQRGCKTSKSLSRVFLTRGHAVRESQFHVLGRFVCRPVFGRVSYLFAFSAVVFGRVTYLFVRPGHRESKRCGTHILLLIRRSTRLLLSALNLPTGKADGRSVGCLRT